MAKVLVTPRSLSVPTHPALASLRDAGHEIVIPAPGKTPDPAVLAAVLPDCAGWLAGVEPVTADLMAKGKMLRIIARNGVGVDNVDLRAANELGIEVATTPGANARGVAELALCLVLALARNVVECDASIKEGGWKRTQGFELRDKTLGLAGCGQIGKTLAEMALGIGMKVLAVDICPDMAMTRENFAYVHLDEMLARSDVLSLHLPGGERPFLDAEKIAALKDGCLVVNTARASLVDAQALLAALDAGKVRGYAVDAFDPEPPGKTPLVLHPRVLCTAHIGGLTAESVFRAASQAASHIVRKLAAK